MFAVQSALTQLSEALAADMIELKRADRLIRVLNIASRNLLKSDKWPASPYHSDQPAPAVDLTAEYGLPRDLDLNTSPEVAFPHSAVFSDLSSRAQAAASAAGVEGPAFRPVAGTFSDLGPMPTMSYCKDGLGCPEHTIRADYPETPELAELREIQATQGDEAMGIRYQQQQRNRRRRHIVTSRKRYAAIALEKNMRLAAERLAEQKLSERASAQPAAQEGCPIPPSFGGVGLSSDTTRKPVTSTTTGAAATEQEALCIA